ncbi:MAG: TIGR04282 family arsenosugar biosynthesis glycosyltransferase [Nitrosomonadales bacterium]|nr:TIGR04282 family arsenosugar biosynthesis glycosyltransferase [Nitrosomonadales bacterium]
MTRIIVFAKAPQAGFAKTRLIPVLGSAGAARFARRMLLRTLDSAMAAAIGPVELCVTPEIVSTAWHDVDIAQEIEISAQGDGDLGARLARATQRALEHDESALLIGTDCVEMSAPLLREAAVALKRKDAVIYPAADGGYALLGLTEFHSSLFSNIAWSTDSVAAETIARIGQLGWSLEVGTPLHDVDEPDDLERIPANWLQAASCPD